jgi:hydrogenase maturation protease
VLVLGIGNILLRDEGIGVHVVEALKAVALPATVEVFDGATAGIDLLDALVDRRKVIVIDAVEVDGPPGMVLRFTPADLGPQEAVALSLHQVGLLEALRMTQLIGCPPEEVVILGVKPKAVEYGLQLTDELTRTVPRILELVLSELKD